VLIHDGEVTEALVLTVRSGTTIAGAGAVALLAGLTLLSGLGPLGWLVGLAAAGTTNALLARGLARRAVSVVHLPNRVTLVRAMLVAGVAALVADGVLGTAHPTAVVTLATIALVLDAVDGQVARRTHGVTELGARFDMEVDAFLILALSGFVAPVAGPWVLAIGGARYAYVVAGWVLPWLRRPVPPRYWRKVVAATQGIVLTVAAAQLLPTVVADLALGAALALLAESFGRDVWWLWLQTRKPARRPIETARLAMAGTR
jgi:phosphatidylglycerophosphate synthase